MTEPQAREILRDMLARKPMMPPLERSAIEVALEALADDFVPPLTNSDYRAIVEKMAG